MLVTKDNALIAIRMAAHTVNAGRVYFAAGSFEPEDFPDGRVDAHGNMVREVTEETGLDISGVRRGERSLRAFDRARHGDLPPLLSGCGREIADDPRFGASPTRVSSRSEPQELRRSTGAVWIIRAAAAICREGARCRHHRRPIIDWHFVERR